MTDAIALGPEPHALSVIFPAGSVGSGWTRTLTLVDAAGATVNYPGGTVVTLEFAGVTWVATVVGSTATWTKDQAAVNAVTALEDRSARLWWTPPAGTPELWAIGWWAQT